MGLFCSPAATGKSGMSGIVSGGSLPLPPANGSWRLIGNVKDYSDQAGTVLQTTYAGNVLRWADSQGGAAYFDQASSGSAAVFDSNRLSVGSATIRNSAPWTVLNSHNISIDRASFSLFAIIDIATLVGGIGAIVGTTSTWLLGRSNGDVGTAFRLLYKCADGTVLGSTVNLPVSKSLIGVVSDGVNVKLIVNGNVDSFVKVDSGTIATLSLCAVDTATSPSNGTDIYEVFGYTRALSAGDITAMQGYAESTGAAVNPRSYVLFENGHSFGQSYNSLVNRGYFQLEALDMLAFANAYNLSQGGLLITDLIATAISAGSPANLFYDSTKFNLSLCSIGQNDVTASVAAATMFTNIATYYRNQIMQGADAVLLEDVSPTIAAGAQRTTQLAYNSLLAAMPQQVCDTLLPIANDAAMAAFPADVAYYTTLHPNDTGHLRRFTLAWQPAVRSWLGKPKRVNNYSSPSLTAAPGVSSITLTWPVVTGATGYNVYRGTARFTETLLGTSVFNSYPDLTAVVGTGYSYRVSAVNGAGEGAMSAPVETAIKTIIAQDDFVGANNTTLNGRTLSPVSPGSTWTIQFRDFHLDGNGHATGGQHPNVACDTANCNTADCTVQVEFTAVNSDGFSGVLLLRAVDNNNGWIVALDATHSQIVLSEFVSGIPTAKAYDRFIPLVGVTYLLTARMNGSQIDVYLNGVWMFSYASATSNQTQTTHGIMYSGNDSTKVLFGHFRVTAN